MASGNVKVRSYHLVVGEGGRIVVPAEARQRAGLTEGTPLVLLEVSDGLMLMTREHLRARVREDLAGLDLVGRLLADRRRAAHREDHD